MIVSSNGYQLDAQQGAQADVCAFGAAAA